MNKRIFCIFPNDPLKAYYDKGEIKKGYFNPEDFFDEVHVISLFDEEIDEESVKEIAGNAKFKIHKLGKANLKNYKNFESNIFQVVKEINPNIIRSYNPFIQGWLAIRVSKKLNIPIVISLHTNNEQQKKEAKNKRNFLRFFKLIYATKKLEKFVLKNADAVICVYDFIVPYAKKVGARNIFVIYNKVDLKKFSPDCSKEFNSKKPTILSVGRLIDQKDHSILIKSIKTLDVKLIIIGNGPNYERLINLVNKLKIEDKVQIIKKVPYDKLNKYYVSCDIYAQPMINLGGIPMPVLEAIASGLPIVMSIKEGVEIIDEAVFFVENDPKEFEKAFQKILSDSNFKNKLIKKGLEKIKKIDSSIMEQKEIELYKKLIKRELSGNRLCH
jgi:glycosyltransferase involved in cell wall biosynthesis